MTFRRLGEYTPSTIPGPVGQVPFGGGAALAGANLPPVGASMPTPGGNVGIGEKQSYWQFITFTAGATPLKVQEMTMRKFMLIQNQSSVETILLGFGWVPTVQNGIILQAGISYEPFSYPINEIYAITLSGNNANGLLVFGV